MQIAMATAKTAQAIERMEELLSSPVLVVLAVVNVETFPDAELPITPDAEDPLPATDPEAEAEEAEEPEMRAPQMDVPF